MRTARTALVGVTMLLAASGLGGCSSSGSAKAAPTTAPATAPSPTPTSAAASATTPAGAATITIQNFAFQPATLTVHPGEKVTVVNKDSTTHTVTASPAGAAFDTGDIAGGGTGQFTAPSTAGTYPYICSIHTFMHGTLTVS